MIEVNVVRFVRITVHQPLDKVDPVERPIKRKGIDKIS